MVKECIICNKKYTPNSNGQKCCSKKCMVINIKNHQREYEQSDKRKIYLKSDKSKQSKLKYCQTSEKHKAYKKAYQKTEKYKIYLKKYHQTEKYKEYHVMYNNIPEVKAKRKKLYNKWAKSLDGKYSNAIRHQRRRECKMNCVHDFTQEEWKDKCKKTNGICPECNIHIGINNLSLDHIFPISKANEEFKKTGIKRCYTIKDIQPLCMSCNSIKRDKV